MKHSYLFLLLLTNINLFSQRQVSGIVLDSNKKPFGYSNICEIELSNCCVSDSKGEFKFQTKKDTTKIVISFFGYKPDTILIRNDTIIKVQLSEQPFHIDIDYVVSRNLRFGYYGSSSYASYGFSISRYVSLFNNPLRYNEIFEFRTDLYKNKDLHFGFNQYLCTILKTMSLGLDYDLSYLSYTNKINFNFISHDMYFALNNYCFSVLAGYGRVFNNNKFYNCVATAFKFYFSSSRTGISYKSNYSNIIIDSHLAIYQCIRIRKNLFTFTLGYDRYIDIQDYNLKVIYSISY